MSRRSRNFAIAIACLVLAGAGLGAYALARRAPASSDVLIIAHGEKVDLAAHAAQGKYTIFDFYAPWCPPCRVLSSALERLAGKRPESIALRKIDIVDWTMPVAAQHGIESLPYLMLYDRQGRRMAEGEEVFGALVRLFGDSAREVNEATHLPSEDAPAAAAPAATGG